MYGQGNYPPQFRPSFQQSQPNPPPPPPFQQAPPGPPPPSIPLNPPHSLTHQAPPGPPPQYQHNVPPPRQPGHSYLQPSPQPYRPPPPAVPGSTPIPPPYSQRNASYPSHHVSQPMPPPQRMFPPLMLPPHSQGPVLYRTPPPPPPGIQHVPAPPPPLHGLVSVTPAPFAPYGQSSTGDICPPSLPPPPPPPPPPSSPPPLPPSPPPPTSPTEDFSSLPEAPSLDPPADGIADSLVASKDNEVGKSENKGPVVKAEALGDLPIPPPKPADGEIVRNMEVLCRFMVNNGPDFENLVRKNEAGKPQFVFLFGGEPGSDAAIGHEYFQWMKKKCLSEKGSLKDEEQNVPSSTTLKMEESSQFGNGDEGATTSPTASDVDMEENVPLHGMYTDDVSQPDADKAVDESGKESAFDSLGGKIHAVEETFPAPRSTTDQLASEAAVSNTLSYTESGQFLHDGEGGKDSLFLEDVSPVRQSPNVAEKAAENNVRESVRVPTEDSSQVNVSSTPAGETMEILRVYVKDGSPFRLIQGYASDDSEEDGKSENAEEINADSTSPTAAGSGLHEDQKSKLLPGFSPDNVSALGIGSSNLQTDSSQLFPLTIAKESATSQSVICRAPVDLLNEVVDLQDDKWNDKIIKCDPSQNNDLLDGDNMGADHQVGKHHLEEDANQDPAKLEVDEFGRLERKGACDSDSDEVHPSERHVNRGRNRSRSRSPQESRWRRSSHSPPSRREKRSQSRSRSPRRMRSKSPPAFRRTNFVSIRDRDQPPECLNFNRGRCFCGASCRFLHRDSTRHISRQQQCDIPWDSGNHGRHDASSFELDKTEEMDIEESSDAPKDDEKSIDIRGHSAQSGGSIWSVEAGELCEKDVFASVADNTLPTVNNDTKEAHVTNLISQVVINHVEKSQVEEAVVEPKCIHIEEPVPSLQADCTLVQSASASSMEPPQTTHRDNVSQPQGVITGHTPVSQPLPSKDFPPARLSGPDVNFQQPQQIPPGPPGPPPLPNFPSDLNLPFPSQHPTGVLHPPATGYQSQPPHPSIFPSRRPPMASDYHSHIMPPNPGWYGIPPPPPTSLAVPPKREFSPMMRPCPPGEMIRPVGGDFHPQTFHSVEPSLQPPFHMDELKRRPLPMGTHYDHPFVREDRFSHPPLPGPQMMSYSQMDYHLRNQSSSCEDARIPLPGQGFASSSSLVQGSTMHPQSLSLPRESLPNRLHSFPGEHVDVMPFSREEFSSPAIKDFPYSHHPPPYGQQQNVSSHYPSNMSSAGLVDPSLQKYPSTFLDNRPPHHNPFASTFEQVPSGTKYSNVSGRENDVNYCSKYDSPFSSGHALVGRPESRLTSSPPDSKIYGKQSIPRAGLDPQENVDALSDERKLVIRNPVAGDAYDPLFDSIEPSSNAPKKFDHIKEPNSAISDPGIASKLSSLHKCADFEDNSKQKGSVGTGHKSEVDEFGEVATDAEVGVVENASPRPETDWSPDLPVDMGNPAAGEIEIDHVRSPGKSKKSKESRSMKLFKVALADFVKEVLKPSWRQGNMSKEAFKTIVKKTVDKVSGAMPSHQIPKSQAKINQYVESSQRKLTKLVMGYVDKYVKM